MPSSRLMGTEAGTPDSWLSGSRLFRATPRVRTPADRPFVVRSTRRVTGPSRAMPTGVLNATTTAVTPFHHQSGPSAVSDNRGAATGRGHEAQTVPGAFPGAENR